MMHTRTTKLKLTTFLIYLIFTAVPSLLISFVLTEQEMKDYEEEYIDKAHWSANLQAKNIDNFIGETIGRLEMLATLIKVQHYNLNNVEEILKETHKTDDRFSGFYWTNAKGDILISSTSPYTLVNIGDRAFFNEAITKKKTSVSNALISRVTGNSIFSLASPVITNDHLLGVLLTNVSLDELEKSIETLITNERITITDQQGETIVQAGSVDPDHSLITYDLKLEHIPWTVTAGVSFEDQQLRQKTFLYYLFSIFVITNILLLLIYNARLKWKGKLEREQFEYQKMEMIGNLAASTAHEIRNPLTGISGLVKLLSEEYHDKKAQYYFDVIQNEIIRINAIVSELLFLGRPTAYTLNTYNMNEILKEIEPILQSEANYMNIDLSISYSKDDVTISCVKDHVKQVILNLSKNSLHAMPDGGLLSISIENHSACCFIIVKDTGIGIPKDELSKIFNPFFTKKKDGSGIGLTVCKRIIDSYHGNISIQSTPGIGTQVEIQIPTFKDDAPKVKEDSCAS
ncbi:hypothetical protein F7731_15245 [Cytobacillus depressus]|uniref:histidine kinase n=1 Tax=Cytobacillus depressus TaxID=1602942 RepID=A0A6L3V3L6_9BACI|nr:ATP-binding protein [Cytobacillus depressus]KAB2334556.1 hypothetical protein F7731_15245 [Cytobacillus depressus]